VSSLRRDTLVYCDIPNSLYGSGRAGLTLYFDETGELIRVDLDQNHLDQGALIELRDLLFAATGAPRTAWDVQMLLAVKAKEEAKK